MNKLDKDYQALLQDILDNGYKKGDRTGTGTLSVYGRQIRHNMKDGFPLLTTKKLHWKSIVGELLWFLKGSTDIRDLWKDNISIWDGDWYKKYETSCSSPYTLEEIKQKVKTGNHCFHNSMFDLGPVYGKQWRSWEMDDTYLGDGHKMYFDQIANLIHDLKTNPDSRRLMVSAWNVGELDQMTLPPCHYGFQVYTRELSGEERQLRCPVFTEDSYGVDGELRSPLTIDWERTPKRAISLMWNQRSVDSGLGLPFNIASYGLLLEIIAKAVNMVPDELIGNLGDTHLYLDHIDPIQEQLTREPYPLPTLNINTEFWPTESGECGVGPLHSNVDFLIENMQIDDFEIIDYQSHPTIKLPLSN